MRIFLTGGAGFIGSHTAGHLIAHGMDVRIYDDLATGSLENLRSLEEREQFVRGDVLDAGTLRAAMHGCDAVIHLAALDARPETLERAKRALAVNTTGTLNVLEAARATGIRRVVLASCLTASDASSSPYAGQKLLGEIYADAFAHFHDLDPVCLRYANVYGPRQAAQSPFSGPLSRFIDAAAARRPVPLPAGDQPPVDYVYVQDVAIANWLALLAPDDLAGAVVEIGGGRLVTAREAYERTFALMAEARPGEAGAEPDRAYEMLPSRVDLARARALLGYAPRVELEDGLARTLAWHRRQQIRVAHRPLERTAPLREPRPA